MVLALLGLLLSGCVTRGTHDAVVAERDALRTAKQGLEAENAALADQLAAAQGVLASTEQRVAAMAATHDQLVSELRSELESGQIQIKKLVDGISLDVSDELLFSSGEARLNEAGKALLARVAGQISGDDSVISVEGHTDDVRVGAALRDRYPTNWELAGARAAIVVRTLSEAGVDPIRMRAVSRGPFAPIASNETAEGRARNRRTEIILRPLPK
jgi:chemotaxis protein MotB